MYALLLDGAHGNGSRLVVLSKDAADDEANLSVLPTFLGIADTGGN